jgi:hypothetical protein
MTLINRVWATLGVTRVGATLRDTLTATWLVSIGIMPGIYSGAVDAHSQFKIDSTTPPRYNNPGIKTSPPCGSDASFGAYRTNRKSIFVSGETITVEWVETINHGGSYVFDFAPANDQGFEQNPIMTVADTQNDNATPHYYSDTIQLNYAPCDACTLRMRQDMDNLQNYYLSCADIVIVSGNDNVPPDEVSGSAVSLVSNGVQVSWVSPMDAKGIVVLRDSGTTPAQLQTRKDYVVGDTEGSSLVVYNGPDASFNDTSVVPDTGYTYTIVAYDADYNYNSGVPQTITTPAATDPGGNTGGNTGGNNESTGGSSGGGAAFWVLIILASLIISQRPAWKRLW